MAPVQRKNMSNPYQRGGSSPVQNPLVLLGGAIFLLVVLFNLFSSDSNASIEDEHTKLRSANSESEMTEEDLKKAKQRQGDLQLQQDIVPEGEDGESFRVKAMEDYNFDDTMYFNHFVKGKPASVIEDMFMAHAYAFHMNAQYGGSCRADPNYSVEKHENLLEAIGLEGALKFSCPADYRGAKKKATIPEEFYHKMDVRSWTPAYVSYLKSLVKYPVPNEKEFVIAVHVRRGKVTPCKSKIDGYDRYLPNEHYMNVIDKYNKPGARVIIFSESESYESLSEFEEKGYEMQLDTELHTIWKTFVSADILILSRSDFSMMPAVVAMGQVVYTPFWHAKLRDWDRVPKEIMETTNARNDVLRAECPPDEDFR